MGTSSHCNGAGKVAEEKGDRYQPEIRRCVAVSENQIGLEKTLRPLGLELGLHVNRGLRSPTAQSMQGMYNTICRGKEIQTARNTLLDIKPISL